MIIGVKNNSNATIVLYRTFYLCTSYLARQKEKKHCISISVQFCSHKMNTGLSLFKEYWILKLVQCCHSLHSLFSAEYSKAGSQLPDEKVQNMQKVI